MRARQRLAAYALIVDDMGRVLLARGPDSRGHAGRWLLPGGGVEHGEHPEQAVIREAWEETGLSIRVGALQGVVSDVATVGRRHWSLHNVRLIYTATIVGSEPRPAGRRLGANARWCSRPEWEGLPLAPFVAKLLEADPS